MISQIKHSWFFLSLGALTIWGGWAFLPKIAIQQMSPVSVAFYTAVGDVCFCMMVWVLLKGRLQKNKRAISLEAFASAIALVAEVAYLYALGHGPVATIATITAMYPIVAVVLAWAVLKEKINRRQFAAGCMAMGAIWLLAGG